MGDSFAACSGAPDRCYEHLLEEGPFGPSHELLNYGVGGYGTDQALLLSFDLIERFADRDPVIVLSLLIDDDLDRCTLPYRGAPKPVLEAAGEREVRIARPAAPLDRSAWFAENPLDVPWWSARFLERNLMDEEAQVEDSGIEARLETMRVAMAAGLLEWKDRLDAHGLDGFVLLFGDRLRHEGVSTKEDRFRWLEAVLEGQQIPWIRAWEELEDDRELLERDLNDYFVTGKVGKGHYTALGNELTHLALERGLRGAFDGPSMVLHESDRQDRIGPGPSCAGSAVSTPTTGRTTFRTPYCDRATATKGPPSSPSSPRGPSAASRRWSGQWSASRGRSSRPHDRGGGGPPLRRPLGRSRPAPDHRPARGRAPGLRGSLGGRGAVAPLLSGAPRAGRAPARPDAARSDRPVHAVKTLLTPWRPCSRRECPAPAVRLPRPQRSRRSAASSQPA